MSKTKKAKDEACNASSEESKAKNRSMGIGKLGTAETVFVRKFRWTLSSEKLSEHFMKEARINFKKKTIHFKCYEAILRSEDPEIEIQDWLELPNHKDEIMTFTTYDGCGQEIYTMKFKGIEVISDEAGFDYADSDASVREVTVSWDSYKREISKDIVLPSEVSTKLLKKMIPDDSKES